MHLKACPFIKPIYMYIYVVVVLPASLVLKGSLLAIACIVTYRGNLVDRSL